MTTVHDHLVEKYLGQLEESAQRLPANQRDELLASMREHIAVTLAESPPTGEAEIRQLLERLGSPEEIVAAALADQPAQRSRPARTAGARPLEIAVVILLLIGGFAAGLGWIAGVVLLWASAAWTTREKLLGTFVVPGGLALPALLLMMASSTATGHSVNGRSVEETSTSSLIPPETAVVMSPVLLIASLAVGIYLLKRAFPPTQ